VPDPDLKAFGAAVRKRRQELGWSQEEFADRCGLHRTYIGGIERGERNVWLKNIIVLGVALKAHPAELVRSITVERRR
jgi:transcriptional regulator with XRE-family HTH domain